MDEITIRIVLNSLSGIPLIQQLKNQFTWLIVTGKILPGDRLPSVRKLSEHLSININTVRSAYQLLERDNLVDTRQGTGTVVLPLDISSIARNAIKLRSNTIGVIIPAITNPFYHSFLQGIEEANAQNQTMMVVCDAHEDPFEAYRFYSKLVAKGVDGIICASLPLAKFITENGQSLNSFPLITVDWPDDQKNTAQVDLESAAYQAVNHLVDHGYLRIALITLEVDIPNTLPLLQGYQRALKGAGRPESAEMITRVPGFSLEDGEIVARRILSRSSRPDAILAISDMLALGAIKEFKRKGYGIPEDFAIIGVGDIYLADMVEPRLTTVSLPSRQLGIEAMKMLQDLIDGKKPENDKVVLQTRLVIRESCGCQAAI